MRSRFDFLAKNPYYSASMKQFLILLGLMFLTLPAQAQTAAPAPATVDDTSPAPHPADSAPVLVTLENLAKAAARLGAIDLEDDRVLDDYARVVHCDIYQRFHGDEFAWRDVRTAMRQSIAQNKDSFPTSFYLYRKETFGPYDFSTHTLPLTGDAVMRRTDDLEMADFTETEQKVCGVKLEVLPEIFVAILDKAVQMTVVPLAEDHAAIVVHYFDNNGVGRVGYGRYLVRLYSGVINNQHGDHRLDFGAHLDNIEFFFDPGFKYIFWSGLDTPIIQQAPERLNSLSGIPFKGIDPGNDSAAPDTPAAPAQP
jgi:hypothetical protein